MDDLADQISNLSRFDWMLFIYFHIFCLVSSIVMLNVIDKYWHAFFAALGTAFGASLLFMALDGWYEGYYLKNSYLLYPPALIWQHLCLGGRAVWRRFL